MPPPTHENIYAIVKKHELVDERRGPLLNAVGALTDLDLVLMGQEESEAAIMASLRARLPGGAGAGGLAKRLKLLVKTIKAIMIFVIAVLSFLPPTESTANGLKVCAVITTVVTFAPLILKAWQKLAAIAA